MSYNPSGQPLAGHSTPLATCQDDPIRAQIDPRTGDYLIGDKGRTPTFNTLRLIAFV